MKMHEKSYYVIEYIHGSKHNPIHAWSINAYCIESIIIIIVIHVLGYCMHTELGMGGWDLQNAAKYLQ